VKISNFILPLSYTTSFANGRCVEIAAAKVPYDPYADLVASDLADTPAVLNAIDKGNCVWHLFNILLCVLLLLYLENYRQIPR